MSAGDASLDDMVGGLDRGLLVTRFHYTNPVHGKRVIITGMTRDGTFLVEGGRIVGPVRNLRFTMSYLDALANVEAVSRERRCIRGLLGGSVVPSLRVSSFSFTGATAARVGRGGRGVGMAPNDRGPDGLRRAGRLRLRRHRIAVRMAVGGDAVGADPGPARGRRRHPSPAGRHRPRGRRRRVPGHESDPAMGAAGYVLALAHARGLTVIREE